MEQLALAFNSTFEGYPIPMTQTAESLTAMIETDDIQRHASLVVCDPQGREIGTGLLAIRNTRGWVGGMAVAPGWRRRGLGTWLITQLLAQARALHLEFVELEVLEENVAAHRLYQQAGFQDVRLLRVFGGPTRSRTAFGNTRQVVPPEPQTQIIPIQPLEAMRNFETFHQVPAPWQRQKASLCHLAPKLDGLALWTTDTVQAYLLSLRAGEGYVVMDFGSQSRSHARRVKDATLLLRQLLWTSPEASIQVVNVPPGDALGDALTALGCQVILRQQEMCIGLN
jgi:GNAT superfamily N-acetyltransferase